MKRSITAVGVVAVSLVLAALAMPAAVVARSAIPAADPNHVNKGVVELETAGSAGITVRMAEAPAGVSNHGESPVRYSEAAGHDDKRPPGGGARETQERRTRRIGFCGRKTRPALPRPQSR